MDGSIGWEWGAIQGPLLPIGPAVGAAGPPARLWGCRETLPHVSVWVRWAAVFLWRRWVRDDGSSHPAEP